MWYLIESNKRKTAILLFLMLIVFGMFGVSLGAFICQDDYSNSEYMGSLIGLGISIVWSFGIFIYAKVHSSKFFLNQAGAVPLNGSLSNKIVRNLVEEMSIASSLGFVPRIYIMETMVPNAFSVGINAKNAAVVVTTGLLSLLNREELQGVIAHEISHIKNQDTLYLMYAGTILGIIVGIAHSFSKIRFDKARSRSGKGGAGVAVVMLITLIFILVIAPLCSRLLYFSVSRKREFLADACACQYTRYPLGLASALQKISDYRYVETDDALEKVQDDEKRDSGEVISCMFIHNFLQNDEYQFFNGLFCTHPPIKKRIKILSKMAGADLMEYNKVYTSVVSNRDIIPVHKAKSLNIVPLSIIVAASDDVKEDEIIRCRRSKDMYKVSAQFKIINCDCGTILKIPPKYSKESVICPHCKKEHNLK